MFICMNPNPPMYVLQTGHEDLGSFHSSMFFLKLTFLISQVVVATVVVLCMLQFQVRNTRSLATDYQDPSDFLLYKWDIFKHKYLIHNNGRQTF